MTTPQEIKELAFRLKDKNTAGDEDVKAILADHFADKTDYGFILSTGGFIGASLVEGSPYKEANKIKMDALAASDKFERFHAVERN